MDKPHLGEPCYKYRFMILGGLEVMLILSILESAEGEENRAELRDWRSSTPG